MSIVVVPLAEASVWDILASTIDYEYSAEQIGEAAGRLGILPEDASDESLHPILDLIETDEKRKGA